MKKIYFFQFKMFSFCIILADNLKFLTRQIYINILINRNSADRVK